MLWKQDIHSQATKKIAGRLIALRPKAMRYKLLSLIILRRPYSSDFGLQDSFSHHVQRMWLYPHEVAALETNITHFSPYMKRSGHPKTLSDSTTSQQPVSGGCVKHHEHFEMY